MNYLEKYKKYKKKYIAGKKQVKGVYAPAKYLENLTPEEQKIRIERMKQGSKTSSKDPHAYRPFRTDFRDGKRIKTKLSQYTKQWNKYFPDKKSLEDKSKVSGVPIEILEQINKKGNAAWRTGHRPGATQQQWGHARVNSFLVKGKTFYTADRKLALQALKIPKARKWFNSIDGLCDEPDVHSWCNKDYINMGRD